MFRIGKFEIYSDNSGQFRWRLKASNGQVIATSGESYTTRAAVEAGIRSVRWNAPIAPTALVTDQDPWNYI